MCCGNVLCKWLMRDHLVGMVHVNVVLVCSGVKEVHKVILSL